MKYAPVVLTVFNRPEHTKKTIDSLAKNKLASKTDLYIFADGSRGDKDVAGVKEVREVISSVSGFKSVTVDMAQSNRGLKESVIRAVSQVIDKHGRAIVLEDDLLTTPNYLGVMNQMLDFYDKDKRIGGVSGYMHSTRIMKFPKSFKSDVFFNVRPCSYGWGMWKDRWEAIDWSDKRMEEMSQDPVAMKKIKDSGQDLVNMVKALLNNEIDSWAVRWSTHTIINNLTSVQPRISYVDNVGFDSSGTHTRNDSYYYLQTETNNKYPLELEEFSGEVNNELTNKYSAHANLSWVYVKRKLKTKLGITLP